MLLPVRAFRLDGSYRTVRDGQVLAVHPSSVLYVEQHPKYAVLPTHAPAPRPQP